MSLSRILALACCVALGTGCRNSRRTSIAGGQASISAATPVPVETGSLTGRCPGYIKDHIVPLACGGPDSVANLQWQTVEPAKAKDKWERKGCGR